MNPSQLGRMLHNHLTSDKGFDCLKPEGYGWTDGGCLILAMAMRRWLGTGRLMGLYGRFRTYLRVDPLMQHHAMLQVGSLYLDGDGISTCPAIALRWEKSECVASISIRPFSHRLAVKGGIPDDPAKEDRTLLFLQKLPVGPEQARAILTASRP